MKKLLTGITQTLLLDWNSVDNISAYLNTGSDTPVIITTDGEQLSLDPAIITKNIYFSIFGEDGIIIKDSDGSPIGGRQFEFDDGINQFKKDLIISADTPDQYLRVNIYSSDVVITEASQPRDYKLEKLSASQMVSELVPINYFVDFILSADSKMDTSYAEAVTGYVNNNRAGIKAFLRSAESRLESKCKLYFQERTITDEKRDNYFDRYSMHLWQFAVYNPPINLLVDFQIKFANQQIANIAPSMFTYDRMSGIIEFLPYPTADNLGLYTLLLTGMSSMSVNIISGSSLDRVPNMFWATYKTGLVYPGCDENEKESIRQAICKKALKAALPIIDPAIRQISRTESIDGVSSARTYGNDKLLDRIDKEEDEFVFDLMRKYARNIDMVVV